MLNIDQAAQNLSSYSARYQSLRNIFGVFQQAIETSNKAQFPVKGISVNTDSHTTCHVQFLDRRYVVIFTVANDQGAQMGKISMCREHGDGTRDKTDIGGVTFNGQGILDIQQPVGADAMMLNDDTTCIKLLLNWLVKDVSA